MKTFIITENDAGQRLDKFLSKALANMPQSFLYKAIRTKRIKVNAKRTQINYRLQPGDEVSVYASEHFFEQPYDKTDFLHAPQSLTVLYEDDHILALDKPVGLLSHADDTQYTDTLLARVQRYLYDKREYDPSRDAAFAPALVNRIDRNTGGIVLAAKDAASLRILNEKMRAREISKRYTCLVVGKPEQTEAMLADFLFKDSHTNTVTVSPHKTPGAKPIQTQYRVLHTNGVFSLLSVQLHTGRTHQIRAHLAAAGYPLLGDGKYGICSVNRQYHVKTQCLYSAETTFAFTSDAGMLNYLAGTSVRAPNIWFEQAFLRGDFS